MKLIAHYQKVHELGRFSLSNYDHAWIIDYKKSKQSILEDENLHKIFSFYIEGKARVMRTVHGKPYINSNGFKSLAFSVSHSLDLAVLFFSAEQSVGVDLECVRERPYREAIARRFFKKDALTLEQFYEEWTAREAFIKALGLRLFDVISHIEFQRPMIFLKNSSHNFFINSALIEDRYILSCCQSSNKPLCYFRF